jgi:hypothetical protein
VKKQSLLQIRSEANIDFFVLRGVQAINMIHTNYSQRNIVGCAGIEPSASWRTYPVMVIEGEELFGNKGFKK